MKKQIARLMAAFPGMPVSLTQEHNNYQTTEGLVSHVRFRAYAQDAETKASEGSTAEGVVTRLLELNHKAINVKTRRSTKSSYRSDNMLR